MANKTTTTLRDFQIVCKLGEGAYAQVFKVQRKEDRLFYAIKKIQMAKMKEKDKKNALNQIRILASQSEQNIIEFKEAFYDQSSHNLCIVMEYAQRGDLMKLIKSHAKRHTKIPESQIWKALVHIAKGLRSLHSKQILHRDLKGANIFINKDGIYKIGDLNVSKVVNGDLAKTQTGTPYYASPQIWKDLPYGTKSDIWSLGCVIYEMAAQKPPFIALDLQTLYKKVCSGIFPRIPAEYSQDLASIISSMLKTNSSDRPSANSILSNSLILTKIQEMSIPLSHRDNNTELLQTIKLHSQKLIQINQKMPKAKYSELKQNTIHHSNIQTSFLKDHSKGVLKQQYRLKIKSCYEQDQQTIGKNTKNIFSVQIKDKANNSQKLPLINQILSQKTQKKTPNINNYVQTPKIESRKKLTDRKSTEQSTRVMRNKINSVINEPYYKENIMGKQNSEKGQKTKRLNIVKQFLEY